MSGRDDAPHSRLCCSTASGDLRGAPLPHHDAAMLPATASDQVPALDPHPRRTTDYTAATATPPAPWQSTVRAAARPKGHRPNSSGSTGTAERTTATRSADNHAPRSPGPTPTG